MKVSVITPSFSRPHHLADLVRMFKAQSHPDKELLILDDSSEPAAEIASLSRSDPAIRYEHVRGRLSVGTKRNMLIEQARGEIIAQFDDDDYYAPDYLAEVLGYLQRHDLFTFSSWYVYAVKDQQFYYWDTSRAARFHFLLAPQKEGEIVGGEWLDRPEVIQANAWGFGFSYAFRKCVYPSVRFADRDHGEDYDFVHKLAQAGFRLQALPDRRGLVLHVVHPGSSTTIAPQYRLPSFLLPVIFGADLFEYAIVARAPETGRPAL